MEKLQTNLYTHNISIRYKYNLHVKNTNLGKHEKEFTIREFNNPPPTNRCLTYDIKLFKIAFIHSINRVSLIAFLPLCKRTYFNKKLSVITTCN